jgi:glucose-6-phosphate-specific signal transduction histidine kinase
VNWRLAQQAGEGQALECSPDVAKWLHDEVVQRLSSVVAALGSEGRLTPADQARCTAELEVALAALGLLLNDKVEPPPQRRFRTVVEAVRAASVAPEGRAVELRLRGDAEVSSRTGELIADFVAESLRNVSKHAEAHAIVLTVTVGEQAVCIDAFNDGVARASGVRGAGIGLRLLAARALDHGGFVSTRSADPDGWLTTLTLARGSAGDAP